MPDASFYRRDWWSFWACTLFLTSQPCLFQTLNWYYDLRTFINETKKVLLCYAACCYHNPSKSSMPTASYCSTNYLELWSLSTSLSISTYGMLMSFYFFFVAALYHSLALYCTLGNAIIFPSFDLACSMEQCLLQYITSWH